MVPPLALTLLRRRLAIRRLSDPAAAAGWLARPFFCLVRDGGELSLTADEEAVLADPSPGGETDAGWRCLRVAGPLDFGLVGVLAGLTGTLAAAGVSILAWSSHQTDYVLVKESRLDAALAALRAAGYRIEAEGTE